MAAKSSVMAILQHNKPQQQPPMASTAGVMATLPHTKPTDGLPWQQRAALWQIATHSTRTLDTKTMSQLVAITGNKPLKFSILSS